MSSKLTSTLKNMVFSLGLISLVAGVLLSLTYVTTKPAIESGRQAKRIASLKAVLPAFDNDPIAQSYLNKEDPTTIFYPARLNGVDVGMAVQATSSQGFSGDVILITGFTPEGKITKISVLSQKETPGLGTKMTLPEFMNQFEGKSVEKPLAVKKDGGEIDAITAATISSRAAVDAVNRAAIALKKGVNP